MLDYNRNFDFECCKLQSGQAEPTGEGTCVYTFDVVGKREDHEVYLTEEELKGMLRAIEDEKSVK